MRDRDGILTYFNSDNNAKVKDCLRLPSGIYIPFSADKFEFMASAVVQYLTAIRLLMA